jgi:hypothetical protein
MKCAIHICMMLIVGLLVPVGAQAHEKPFHHVHPKKKVVVKKKKKPKVVYEQEPQVVYVERERKPQPIGNSSFSIRGLGSTLSGNKLGLSDYENSPVGGIGFAFRGMVDRNWAVELSMDFLGGGQLDYYQSQVPIQLSFIHYFAPASKVRPYIVGGGGVQFTNLQYGNGAYAFDMTEIVNHAGVGALVKIGKRLSLSTDLRAVGSWATVGNTLILEGCAESGTCPPDAYVVSGDRFNVGAQFMAAFSYNF